MPLKTRHIIEVKGGVINGGIVDGIFINANKYLSSDIKWTALTLRQLKSDLDELIPLLEGVELAEKLAHDDSEDTLNDLEEDDWDI